MNKQLINKGRKEWHDANQSATTQKQSPKRKRSLLSILLRLVDKSPKSRQVNSNLASIFIYYLVTLPLYPLFYGFHDPDVEVYASQFSFSMYLMTCSLAPLLAMTYVAYSLLFDSQFSLQITKILACGYFLLVVNNVIMAIAVHDDLAWSALDSIDTFINGNSEWWFPFGAADVLLMGVTVVCLLIKLTSSDL